MKFLTSTTDYRVVYVNPEKGLYRLIVKTSDGEYIAQTGSAVTKTFSLPTEVRVRKIGWIHTTSTATTLSTDSLIWYFDVYSHGGDVAPLRYDNITTTESTYMVELGEKYEEPVEQVKITTNTTNNDRVYIYIDVQVMGRGV